MSSKLHVVFLPPKMMPGQTPYTAAELKKVKRLIADACKADVTEQDEVEGRAYPKGIRT